MSKLAEAEAAQRRALTRLRKAAEELEKRPALTTTGGKLLAEELNDIADDLGAD